MQLAELHGLRTPRFSREGAPEAWQCWADRVLNLNTCRPERLAEMSRDADRAAGYAASPSPIVTVEQHFLRNLALRDRALTIVETAEAELTAIIEAMDIEADDVDLEDGSDDERQRRLREKRRHTESRCDSALPPSPSSPDKERSPTPPKEIKPPTTLASGESAPARDAAPAAPEPIAEPVEAKSSQGETITVLPSTKAHTARHTPGVAFAASRLPTDFQASAEDREFGKAEGLTDAEIDRTV